MEESVIILIVIMALVASFLFRKYINNARVGIIIRIASLLTMMIIFFVFSIHHFNLALSLTVGFVGVAALVYFIYRLRSMKQNADY